MKRTMYVWIVGVVLVGMSALPAAAQSSVTAPSVPPETPLGDYARTVRNNKKSTAKQFDNDNLPKDDKLSVVGGATSSPTSADAKSDTDAKTDAENKPTDEKPQVKPGQSAEERQQVYDEWQSRLAGQKAQVDLLSRELDVAQREYKLRVASMYGDAGDRLRNSADWDKEDAQYKEQIAEKQKALDEAKNEMNDMQEDARKAGIPSSVTESAGQAPPQPAQPPAQAQPQPK